MLALVIDLAVAFVFLLVFAFAYGVDLHWTSIFVPLFLLLDFAVVLGVGLFLAALNVRYRDVFVACRSCSSSGSSSRRSSTPASLVTGCLALRLRAQPDGVGVSTGIRWALFADALARGRAAARLDRCGDRAARRREPLLPPRRALLRRRHLRGDLAIEAERARQAVPLGQLPGRLRPPQRRASARPSAASAATARGRDRFWALRRRQLRGRAGRGARDHRPQRRRQEHAAEDPLPHHRADDAACARVRGRVGSAARGRHRLPPGADRAREHLPQRRHPRHAPRARSARKFDEIVEFAEVERFIDTPVKRYSSGMYLRLAFAVAAHLEPEILIVDEVLAVGDAAFQKKCLGQDGRGDARGAHRALRQPQHGRRGEPLPQRARARARRRRLPRRP